MSDSRLKGARIVGSKPRMHTPALGRLSTFGLVQVVVDVPLAVRACERNGR